jgi:hypothetical protein
MIIMKPRFLKIRLGRQFLAANLGPPLHTEISLKLTKLTATWHTSVNNRKNLMIGKNDSVSVSFSELNCMCQLRGKVD